MSEIRIITLEAGQTWALRQRVMWPDRPLEDSMLADDASGLHYGLLAEGEIVSVISLFEKEQEVQLRKFATLVEKQKRGYGSALFAHCLNECAKKGVKAVWCNARSEKTGFYRRFGLSETGERFNRNGREYLIMRLVLKK